MHPYLYGMRSTFKHKLDGQKFGKWTVVRELGRLGSSGDIFWECRCECGRLKPVKAYYLTKSMSRQCSYCHKHGKRFYSEDRIPKQLWDQIVRNAQKRGIPIHITPEEAYEIYKSQGGRCALSGVEIHFPRCATEFRNATASMDRIVNSNGYTRENVQWLHKDVNRMKNTHQQDYFIALCRKVASHSK